MTEIPSWEPPVYSLAPPLDPAYFERRSKSGERRSVRGIARRRGIPLLAAAAIVALLVSDVDPGASGFWREHQVITSLVTGVVLTLIAVFVLERVLAARDRRRWRAVGLMVAGKFEAIEIEEILAIHVYEYRRRKGEDVTGKYGEDYLELLPEALEDPETWIGREEQGVPPLVDWLRGFEEELEQILEVWAPVLIAAPGLAAIADAATDLLTTIRCINNELRFGAPASEDGFEGKWEPGQDCRIRLLAALHAHRFAYMRMRGLLAAYERA